MLNSIPKNSIIPKVKCVLSNQLVYNRLYYLHFACTICTGVHFRQVFFSFLKALAEFGEEICTKIKSYEKTTFTNRTFTG